MSSQSKQWSFADMVKALPEKKVIKQDSTEVLPSGKKFVRKKPDAEAVGNDSPAVLYHTIFKKRSGSLV